MQLNMNQYMNSDQTPGSGLKSPDVERRDRHSEVDGEFSDLNHSPNPSISKKQKQRQVTAGNITAYGIHEGDIKKIQTIRSNQSSAQALRTQTDTTMTRHSIQPTTHHKRGHQMTLMQGLGPGGILAKNVNDAKNKTS